MASSVEPGSLDLTAHARRRMRERHITAEDISRTLQHYWLRVPDPTEPDHWEYQGRSHQGRSLTVWVPGDDTPDRWPKRVISAAWDEEEKQR